MSEASPAKDSQPQPRRFLWFYLPDLSLLRRTPVRVALLANFLSGLAIGTLSYGAMVHLARSGGSQFEIVLGPYLRQATMKPCLIWGTIFSVEISWATTSVGTITGSIWRS